MQRNRLTQEQYYILNEYIKGHAFDGEIKLYPGQIAEAFNEEHDFTVKTSQVKKSAEIVGVKIKHHNKGKYKTEKPEVEAPEGGILKRWEWNDMVSRQVRNEQRLIRIEEKLDALLKAWEVKCGS